MSHWLRHLPEVGGSLTGGLPEHRADAPDCTAGHIERMVQREAQARIELQALCDQIAHTELALYERARRASYSVAEIEAAKRAAVQEGGAS